MVGVINLDKPAGRSSARVVSRVKRLLPRGTKIGHAGTLDPFATGVLLLLIGKATKLSQRLMDQPKQYEATIRLGATTATDDADCPEMIAPDVEIPPADVVRQAVTGFVGLIQQRPPAYSALRVAGRHAYELARGGKEVTLNRRPVQVYGIEILSYEWPLLRLRIDCGRGTYIRAIARDLGEQLAVGGYLSELRRTRIGPFNIESSLTLERLIAVGVQSHLLWPIAEF